MNALTVWQEKALSLIKQSIATRGFPPTLRELRSSLGVNSIRSVSNFLAALEKKGKIRRDAMLSRGIVVVDPPADASEQAPEVVAIKVYDILPRSFIESNGYAAPIDEIPVDPKLVPGEGKVVALRVLGRALDDIGIRGGDDIIIRLGQEPKAGDLVAALLEDHALDYVVVRRFEPTLQPGVVTFSAHESTFVPVVIRQEDFRPSMVVGVAVALLRNYFC